MPWVWQFKKKVHTIQSHLQIQCNPSQNHNGIFFKLISLYSWLPPFIFFLGGGGPPTAWGSSQARDQTQATAMTMLNPLSHQRTPQWHFFKEIEEKII